MIGTQMNIKAIYLVVLFLLTALAIFVIIQSTTAGQPPEVPTMDRTRDQQELIFLLQYMGRDYQNAVQDRKIISDFEYREMVAFGQRAMALYLSFEPDLEQNFTLVQLQQLRQMVHARVDQYEIMELTKMLIFEIAQELTIERSPATTPDVARGEYLYLAGGCGACHGADGRGDGPAAEWLDPPPNSFEDVLEMNEATPYRFVNATLLGIAGTGMPSYEQAFSRGDAWDVAFYLMTLREGFSPSLADGTSMITLQDLASKSNTDLLHELEERQAGFAGTNARDRSFLSASIDFLRQHPQAAE